MYLGVPDTSLLGSIFTQLNVPKIVVETLRLAKKRVVKRRDVMGMSRGGGRGRKEI